MIACRGHELQRGLHRATLTLVRARVLCQMRAPYRPITAHKNFPLPPIAGTKTAGLGAAVPLAPPSPLNAALGLHVVYCWYVVSQRTKRLLRDYSETANCRVYIVNILTDCRRSLSRCAKVVKLCVHLTLLAMACTECHVTMRGHLVIDRLFLV